MARVDQLYKAWYGVFNDTLLPLMITAHQPKWYSSSDNLKGGDVVYFRKESGVLSGPWTIGMVDTAIRGRDDHVREVDIRYQNSTENKHRITRRSVRSVISLQLQLSDVLFSFSFAPTVKYICRHRAPNTAVPF